MRNLFLENKNNLPYISAQKFAFSIILLTGLLSGCATHIDSGGQVTHGVDMAALFGIDVGSFKTIEGHPGTLRSNDKSFSLKLEEFSQVVPLGTHHWMKISSVAYIGKQTVLTINYQEEAGGCGKTLIVAIEGNQVSRWQTQAKDCRHFPRVTVNDNHLKLIYQNQQFIYQNNNIYQRDLVAPLPAPAPTPQGRKPAPPKKQTPKAAPAAPKAIVPESVASPLKSAEAQPHKSEVSTNLDALKKRLPQNMQEAIKKEEKKQEASVYAQPELEGFSNTNKAPVRVVLTKKP